MPMKENSYKIMHTTKANFTTIRRVHTSCNDQTDPYTLHGTISLAYTTLTPKRIPAPQQDRAVEEPELGIPQDLPIYIEDRS